MIHRSFAARGILVATLATACVTPGQSASTPGATASPSPVPTASQPQPSALSSTSPSIAPSAGPDGEILVPGTHVGLTPPAGFFPSLSFPGFEHECGASIVVAELPTSYEEIAAGLTDEAFAGQGITVQSRFEETVDGRDAMLIVGRQDAAGMTFGKILVITGTEELVAFLTGNWPISTCGLEMGNEMSDSELRMSFDPDRVADPQAALNFTIEPAPPLQFAGVFGNGAAYNSSGTLPSADIDEPVLIVAPSLGASAGDDLEAFAGTLLESSVHIRDVTIESTEQVTVAGRPGVVLIGSGSRTSRPGDVVVYQLLLGGDGDYVVMLGLCEPPRRGECLEAFDATARSYRPKV